MNKFASATSITVIAAFSIGCCAWSQPHAPLQYHGGPVLRTFRIYPLYYGVWSSADIEAHWNYVSRLARYMSGHDKPAGQQPMMWQYGVNEVTVAPATSANPSGKPVTLKRTDVLKIIHDNQANGQLPAFDDSTLIMVFPSHLFRLDGCNGCGYHSSESTSAFWSVVPRDVGPNLPLVTAHEIFEAAINPAVDNDIGWDESVDGCTSIINLSFGQIPGAADNTQNGTCSTTGYSSTDEVQVYGWSYADYRKKYDELWPQGWRLYILQSYVLPDGRVLYNAVWHRWTGDETQVYGWSYADYRKKYDELWPQGWRLFILQPYVMSNGKVLYNAVWRRGSLGEIQAYDCTYDQYRNQYDRLWTQKWRLGILQSYVSNGRTLYDAAWVPGDTSEFQVYGWSYTDYRKKYDELWTQGWRLYVLQAYVAPNGSVRYNAVWRPGRMPEIQLYGASYTDYRRKYDGLWSAGWRLYILDTYVMGDGQVRYDAVWRLGASDRPL